MKAGATGSPEVGLVNGTARQEELVPAVIRWSDEAPHAGKLSASDGPSSTRAPHRRSDPGPERRDGIRLERQAGRHALRRLDVASHQRRRTRSVASRRRNADMDLGGRPHHPGPTDRGKAPRTSRRRRGRLPAACVARPVETGHLPGGRSARSLTRARASIATLSVSVHRRVELLAVHVEARVEGAQLVLELASAFVCQLGDPVALEEVVVNRYRVVEQGHALD
jgi:hypothetical protein